MGLDMYLTAERYIFRHRPEDDKLAKTIQKLLGGDMRVKTVTVEAAYWRKANAIHKWFVEKVQGGKDDCKPYHVTREKLQELLTLCQTVLEAPDKASKKLPTKSGFFFGSTEYGEAYLDDITATVEMLEKALALSSDWEFEYRSSW